MKNETREALFDMPRLVHDSMQTAGRNGGTPVPPAFPLSGRAAACRGAVPAGRLGQLSDSRETRNQECRRRGVLRQGWRPVHPSHTEYVL